MVRSGKERRGVVRAHKDATALRNGKGGDLATSGGLEGLAPKIECLLHRAVRKTEQHRLFIGFEPAGHPGRADEHFPGPKAHRLAPEPPTPFASAYCPPRAAAPPPPLSLQS